MKGSLKNSILPLSAIFILKLGLIFSYIKIVLTLVFHHNDTNGNHKPTFIGTISGHMHCFIKSLTQAWEGGTAIDFILQIHN